MISSGAIGLTVMLLGLIVMIKFSSWTMTKYLTYAVIATPLSLGTSGCVFYIAYAGMTHYSEVWNMTARAVIYYEPWVEEEEICTTDSEGNTTCNTNYIHHSEYWVALDEYNNEHDISHADFDFWKDVWQNVVEEDLTHFGQTFSSRRNGEGDRWLSLWDGSFETMLPWSVIHTYTNKLRASHTVFDYVDVDDATREAWPRPADDRNTSPIFGYGVQFSSDEEMYLRRLNAMWGPKYEIHTIMLLFDTTKYPDRSIMETVLSAWKGPNKNELIVFVGVNPDGALGWCDVASWMDDTTIHSLIRQDIMQQKQFEVASIAKVYKKYIPTKWKRKEFEDFSFVKINIPKISYLYMILASCIGIVVGGIITEAYHEHRRY